MRRLKTVILIAGCALLFALPLRAQSRGAKCEPSLDLANMQHTLACLTDQTRTKEPIADFWPVTTVGDIAFFYLCDLFRDSTWEHSTIDGVVTWKTLEAEYPGSPSWTVWYEFVKKHGRTYVQNVWSEK